MFDKMKILNREIGLGESAHIKMDIAKLYTRSTVEVSIFVSRGNEEGPCLLLVGGIHGDEVNGVEIVRQIITKGLNKPTKGTVICIPLVNVFGFLNQERKFPDGRDLNRVFPGTKTGSLASRFAYHLMKDVIPYVDYCIDYHTGGAERFNCAQLRISGTNDENLHLAKVFGAPFIMFAKNREKTFRESMTQLGKRVLLFEGGKSLSLDKTITQTGVQGAINVMHELGMRDFSSEISMSQEDAPPIIIKKSKWIRAKHSGLYRPTAHIGEKVEKGVELGSISCPFGVFEEAFKNTQEGHILCANLACMVNQGDALFHIGFE